MSYRAKTQTPIIDTQCLIEALQECKVEYQQNGYNVVIQYGYRGIIYQLQGRQYMVEYYRDHRDEVELVGKIETIYTQKYQAKLESLRLEAQRAEELEKLRLQEELRKEQERLEQLKNEQKQKLIAQVKKQGYQVKESVKNGKIQLVCVRYV